MALYVLRQSNKGSGFYAEGRAGENLPGKNLAYLNNDGRWYLADATVAAELPVLGITMGTIRQGQIGSILQKGYIGKKSWTWTMGGRIYASDSTHGALTQTSPTNPDYLIQEIGIAISPTKIFFSPRQVLGASGPTKLVTVNVSADELGKPAANNPTVVDKDNLTLYSFTVGTDFMTFKLVIPNDYATGGLKFATVWTNDGGVDDSGKNVKAQFDYQTASDGDSVAGSHGNSPKSVVDTYASASGWIQHRTDYVTVAESDFINESCIYVKVSFVAAPPTALTCEPHLIGLCFQYIAYALG